jgi:hypothetical protein
MSIEAKTSGWFADRPVAPPVMGSRAWLLWVAVAVMATAAAVGVLGRAPVPHDPPRPSQVHRVAGPTGAAGATTPVVARIP